MANSKADEQAVRLILRHLRKLKKHDPRAWRGENHPLVNVLFIALCATLCGANGFKAMARFGRAKRAFFAQYLDLEGRGVPSTCTFRRLFGALSPHFLQEALQSISHTLARAQASAAAVGSDAVGVEEARQRTLAMDGKSVRGALKEGGGCLHVLHAWASERQLLVGHVPVEGGTSGEVKALSALIRSLEVVGPDTVVTADANGCTQEVAAACVEKGADYVLALKGNRGPLFESLATLCILHVWQGKLPRGKGRAFSEEVWAHGRYEKREAWALTPAQWPMDWPGLASLVLMRRERQRPGKPLQVHWHMYVSSLPPNAPRLARTIRKHWSVENNLHWVLDVQMGEDRRRVRHKTAADNLARLTRTALDMLKREKSLKAGIELKRQEAGWDEAYLLKVLTAGIS